MTLIKSISGIRGTIGGTPGNNLTPIDIVECTTALGQMIREKKAAELVVIGRDARISGPIVNQLVINTLLAMGIDVIDLGLSTTPTVEMAVPKLGAGAGVIITASHNPKQWNALKFLNEKGEFISREDGQRLLELIAEGEAQYAEVDQLGTYQTREDLLDFHLNAILELPYVDADAIRARKFRVVVDGINSSGGVTVPVLLRQLGCEVILLNGEPHGNFAHNPEPLPAHLAELSETVVAEAADLGISVDPDVDRLAFVDEKGQMFGEEYTLVAVADHVLSHRSGNTVSNLSSTRALRDVTNRFGGQYAAAAVGEVNVVNKMKEVDAVIGGEGNGGVILPELHYGRDALAGIGLFLSLLAARGMKVSELKASYPEYFIIKDRIELTPAIDVDHLINSLHEVYREEDCNRIDGLKIDFAGGWVHLRKSNTEPIIRVYAESRTEAAAREQIAGVHAEVEKILNS